MQILSRRRRATLWWGTAVCLPVAIAAAAKGPRATTVLETPVRGSWTRLPLRDWAARVTAIAGVPVIVDRRIDPTLPVTLDADGDPLGTVLDAVATAARADVEVLAASIRLVPPEAAGRAVAAESARSAELRRLPAADRTRLAAKAACEWHEAAEPRSLVEQLAADAGLRLTGLERIPHDHVAAGRLLPLSVAERIDAMLAHFDLRASWTPDGGAVVPAVERAAPISAADDQPRTAPAPRGRPGRPAATQERHTLRLEAPLDQAVTALAKRFKLRPEIDVASLAARGIAAGEIVRVRVADVTRDELFDAVVAPLGLSWAIEGDALRVFAPPPHAPDAAP